VTVAETFQVPGGMTAIFPSAPARSKQAWDGVVGDAVAEAAEVGGQHGLTVAEVLGEAGLRDRGVEDEDVVDTGGHGVLS
jgi:hypothetical protein